MKKLIWVLLLGGPCLWSQERKVAPTWLHRYLPDIHEQREDLTTSSCHYLPIFGEGDSESRLPKTVARFGELKVDPHGDSVAVEYPQQEVLFFVLDGIGALQYGDKSQVLRKNDFTYVPPKVRHKLSNPGDQPFRVVVMSFMIPTDVPISPPPEEIIVANLDELKEQTVEGHPSSVLYKLLIGPRTGSRDRINAAHIVADLFMMDFAPGGTNFPHHHESAEEIYLVLDGAGQMVAGGGLDGVEGLHPAKAGDAYYFRPNCTVGFYNQKAPEVKAHILAVRAFVRPPRNSE